MLQFQGGLDHGYSNAQIVAAIAMIKTYNKEGTILDIYNFLRNFCLDLGDSGKDNLYGYGMPQFSKLTISDIDKDSPEFTAIEFENETWEALKQVKIKAKDNIRIHSWAVTTSEENPKTEEWKVLESLTPELDVVSEITKNGKYYIWVRDSAGNTIKQDIQVDKVDNTPPKIAYTIDKTTLSSGYVTINVTAEDNESGLYDSPFSWDKITWTKEDSTKRVTQNGRYKVYAEDNLGNISEQEIVVDCFPQEGRYNLGDGNIIRNMYVSAEWNENTNNNVQIVFNQGLNIVGWQITNSVYAPNDFVEINRQNSRQENNNRTNNTSAPRDVLISNMTINNNVVSNDNQVQEEDTEPITITISCDLNVTYYLWVKDRNGNVNYQSFSIAKAEV